MDALITVDGFSRLIVWLEVNKTTNDPKVVASFFMLSVEEHGGCILANLTLQNQKDAYWRSATLLGAKLSTFSEIFQNIV